MEAFTGASLDYVEQPEWWGEPVPVIVNMPPWYFLYTEPLITDFIEIDGVDVDLNLYSINGTKSIDDIYQVCKTLYVTNIRLDRLCTLVYFTKYYKQEE